MSTYDLSVVKQAAAGRWVEILHVVGGLPLEILDGKYHPCPKCGKGLFRLVSAETGDCFCTYCFRGGPANGG